MIGVMIVDDEDWVRRGIRSMLEWEKLGFRIVSEAKNGQQAIEQLAKATIDVVLTDIRMPGVDGIRLMEYLRAERPEVVTIVISGYSDFQYAQKAITFQAFDYILKPIDEDALTAVLARAAEHIGAKRALMNEMESLRSTEMARQEISRYVALTDLVCREHIQAGSAAPVRGADLSRLTSDLGTGPCAALVVRFARPILSPSAPSAAQDARDVRERILEFAGDRAGESRRLLTFKNVDRPDELVILSGSVCHADGQNLAKLRSLATTIRREIFARSTARPFCGISDEGKDNACLPECYRRAARAAECAGIINPATGVADFAELSRRNKPFVVAQQLLKRISHFVENGFAEQLFGDMDALFHEIETDSTLDPAGIRSACVQIVVTAWSHVTPDAYGGATGTDVEAVTHALLDDARTVDELKAKVGETLDRVMAINLERHNHRHDIEQITEYVRSHYHESINLNIVADRFGMNASYLSRVFKERTGMNFGDCLTDVRMRAAADLLRNKDLRMDDIAEVTGYQSTAYFLSKFRKHFGCTPTEYRGRSGLG